MNFGQLQTRLGTAVLRSDLAPDYGNFINEALVEIQNRRSWTCMKVTEPVTLGPGTGFETAVLQTNFKELRRQPSVNFVSDCGGLIPATVVFAEEEVWRVWAWGGAPMFIWPPRVFLIRGAPTPTQIMAGASVSASIGILEPLISTFNLTVGMFGYLPTLVNSTDVSPLALAYPNMVLEKAKAIAFSGVNDEECEKAEAKFDIKFREASYQDGYSETAGRVLRM
jgi:hypothetical protein